MPADLHFDPFDPGVLEDPYPWYRWLRTNAPCYYAEKTDLYVLTRQAESIAVLRDAATFSSAEGITYGEGIDANLGIVTTDPPHHGHLRKIVSRSFAPKAIQARREAVAELVDSLVEEALDNGTVDLVQAFSLPLPTKVISEILGVPTADQEKFRRWSIAITHLFDDRVGPAERAVAEAERDECRAYLRALIDERMNDDDEERTSSAPC